MILELKFCFWAKLWFGNFQMALANWMVISKYFTIYRIFFLSQTYH